MILTLWGNLTYGSILATGAWTSVSCTFTCIEYIRIDIPNTIESIRDKTSGNTAIPINAIPVSASPRLVLKAILLTFFYSNRFSKLCP